MALVLTFTKRYDYLALSLFLSMAFYLIINTWLSSRSLPGLMFSIKDIQISRFKQLFKKGMAFQAFPLGNALLFQGNLLVVQFMLGPAAVALFATVRTLVRSVNQLMEMVNAIIWPELSVLIGTNNLPKAARLHRMSVGFTFIGSMLSVLVLSLFGHSIYTLWVGKSIALPQHLLVFFLLPIIFNAVWYTSSVVHTSSNQHEGLAVRYIIGCALTVAGCAILSKYYGVEGAALSTLIGDLIMVPYVLRRSLEITGDTMGSFLLGIGNEIRTGSDTLKQIFERRKKTIG